MPIGCVEDRECDAAWICERGACVPHPGSAEGIRLAREVLRRSATRRMAAGTVFTLAGAGVDALTIAYRASSESFVLSDLVGLEGDAVALGLMGTGMVIAAAGAEKAAEVAGHDYAGRRAFGWTLFLGSVSTGLAAGVSTFQPANDREPLVLTGISSGFGLACTAWFVGSAARDLHVALVPTPGGAALAGTW